VSNHAVEFALGGSLDGRVEHHGEEEGFELGGGLPAQKYVSEEVRIIGVH
jgi:hypothetical protein